MISSLFPRRVLLSLALALTAGAACAQNYIGHDRSRPLPPVVTPATPSTDAQVGKAPSDAIVLFDGTSLGAWVDDNGEPTKWALKDGALECVPGSGFVRTVESFGACQLHLEFATPAVVSGSGQGRGNSGLFLGGKRYEIQILDSYENPTYADGSCGSIYNQFPPEVNASRKPGEWQTYDLIWTPPVFDAAGKLVSPALVTLFHNGVLVHHNRAVLGDNNHWFKRRPYEAHPAKLPIAFQDHGNTTRFRNIWVRPLDGGRREIQLGQKQLDRLAGTYRMANAKDGNNDAVIRREGDQLILKLYNNDVPLRATFNNTFFYSESDAEIVFTEQADAFTLFVGGTDSGTRRRL